MVMSVICPDALLNKPHFLVIFWCIETLNFTVKCWFNSKICFCVITFKVKFEY